MKVFKIIIFGLLFIFSLSTLVYADNEEIKQCSEFEGDVYVSKTCTILTTTNAIIDIYELRNKYSLRDVDFYRAEQNGSIDLFRRGTFNELFPQLRHSEFKYTLEYTDGKFVGNESNHHEVVSNLVLGTLIFLALCIIVASQINTNPTVLKRPVPIVIFLSLFTGSLFGFGQNYGIPFGILGFSAFLASFVIISKLHTDEKATFMNIITGAIIGVSTIMILILDTEITPWIIFWIGVVIIDYSITFFRRYRNKALSV